MRSASKEPDVSVIVGTYNRCNVLRGALESLRNQDCAGTEYEVIVVDNNSTDETRTMVENLRDSLGYDNLVYCFGGKVLPQPTTAFPVWLTDKHWTPLALLDLGDGPIELDVRNGPGLVAANLAVRASVFSDVGLFQPHLQRVKNSIGSMEDHEFQLRLTAAKKRLMYLPELVVYAHVLEERLTKDYHRRWYHGHGYFYAVMRAHDFEASKMRVLDVPAHVYRRALLDVYAWLKCRFKNEPDLEFQYEVELSFFCGFFRKRLSDLRAGRDS